MRIGAFVAQGALLPAAYKLTHVFGVEVALSLAVFGVVEVHAMLVGMLLGVGAGAQLEVLDVEVLSSHCFTLVLPFLTSWYLRLSTWGKSVDWLIFACF